MRSKYWKGEQVPLIMLAIQQNNKKITKIAKTKNYYITKPTKTQKKKGRAGFQC